MSQEGLVDEAHRLGRAFTARLSRDEQRRFGQFMTPPTIARFMARGLVAGTSGSSARILEPAAGAGVLAAAVVEELLRRQQPLERIELVMFELDAGLASLLRRLGLRMQSACESVGVTLGWQVIEADFLLSELATGGMPVDGLLTIANPPFFKLNKADDLRAQLHDYAVHGQPNIYGLFMAACARLTPHNGRWCFVTPRSWMAGAYFTAVRQTLLRFMTIDGIHAFENRRQGFADDAVLQETVIAWAGGRSQFERGVSIRVSRSVGAYDLDICDVQALAVERVVGAEADVTLSLPVSGGYPFSGWTATLKTYGLEVSTGPVVAFRASEFIRESGEPDTVPLLWLQHIGQQRVSWPIRKKREHIKAAAASSWMLLSNEPMVLMRRFSPKEDSRRVTCAAYDGKLPGQFIGLENHLNYIHRPGARMSEPEVRGWAGFLASSIADAYFRACAGSTQVNATDLRHMPLPSLSAIEAIGRALSSYPELPEIDKVVEEALGRSQESRAAA